MSLLWFSDTQW